MCSVKHRSYRSFISLANLSRTHTITLYYYSETNTEQQLHKFHTADKTPTHTHTQKKSDLNSSELIFFKEPDQIAIFSEGFHWHLRPHLITVHKQNVCHLCHSELADLKAVGPLCRMQNRAFPRHHRVSQDCTMRHKTTAQPAAATTWHFFLQNTTIFPPHLAPL